MKTIKLTVELTFANNINSDKEIANVAKNVLDTLEHEVECGIGLAPDETETYTTKIVVTEQRYNTDFIKTF